MGNLNLPNHFFSDSNTMRAKMKEKQNHRMRRRCTRIPSIQWNMPVLTLLLCIYVTNVFARGTEPTTLLPAPEVLAGNITSSSLTVTFPSLVSAASGDVLAYELQYKAITAHEWTSASSTIESPNQQREAQILSIKVDEGKTINDGYFILGLQRAGGISSTTNERRDIIGNSLFLHFYFYAFSRVY